MSLTDLMNDDLPEEESEESDDHSFELDGQPPPRSTAQDDGEVKFGVPYGDDEGEDSDEEEYAEGGGDDDRTPNDEILFSHERFFSPRLQELLRGSMSGGDPASQTGLLTGVRPMLLHQSQSPHPERPARMVAIYHEIIEQGLDSRCRLVPARTASTEDLELVHSAEQVKLSTGVYETDEDASLALGLDSDTYFAGSTSGHAARLSAGSVIELVTRVVQGELRNALAVVRPPGHHCEHGQAMGFCVLNNVCAAVAVAQRKLGVGRVLIVDWDVHHGNGVQHIFDEDPSVLYVSTHRYGDGFYPGTGHPTEVGLKAGAGTSVNMAFSETEMGDREYLAAFDRLVMPIAREFAPELVIVSAGFDAAEGDPLGEMSITPAGYAHMTAQLSTLAGGKIVVALEGGYNLRAISRSAAASLRVLLGDSPPTLVGGPPKPAALGDIEYAVATLAPYWQTLRPPQPETRAMRPKKRKLRHHRGPVRWPFKPSPPLPPTTHHPTPSPSADPFAPAYPFCTVVVQVFMKAFCSDRGFFGLLARNVSKSQSVRSFAPWFSAYSVHSLQRLLLVETRCRVRATASSCRCRHAHGA
jgi:acetoin utilization deacetylase AcuC-like enzyme